MIGTNIVKSLMMFHGIFISVVFNLHFLGIRTLPALKSGMNNTIVKKMRGNLGSSKPSSKMERSREWTEGAVIETGEDLGDDETNFGFPPFCATCEKQIDPINASHLYCSEACRLCDSKLEANGTSSLWVGRTGRQLALWLAGDTGAA
ncbi:hypothetical protein O988_07802 [Pseudogymnoascus sp. VKM F-3808]|nr:hypothetical protein O988_07802 [Pseudogymnoascus sp. VKM F-3808]